MNKITTEGDQLGLKINIAKTKVMAKSIYGKQIQHVEKSKPRLILTLKSTLFTIFGNLHLLFKQILVKI